MRHRENLVILLLVLSVVCISTIGNDTKVDTTDKNNEFMANGFTLSQTPEDTDGDGLSDADEIDIYGTEINNPDTDGDGCPDGWEVARGLDPLEWTYATGQAGENFMIAMIPTLIVFLGALIGLILTAVLGINNRILHALRLRILLVPAILFLVVFLLAAPVEVYGTTDPGVNVQTEESSSSLISYTFYVLDSGWFSDQVTISASYYASYSNVYLSVYVEVRKAGSTIGTYDLLLGGGYLGQQKSKSVTLNLEPGMYIIRRTYTYESTFGEDLSPKSFTFTVAQSERDGRNVDQITWQTTRMILLGGGIGAILVGIFLKTNKINRRAEMSKKMEEQDTHIGYQV
jgi:hypothetical protein